MRALIHEVDGAVGVGALDIAGRPLLVRQLQWLRDLGIEDVVVEVARGAADVTRGALLLGSDPLVARVRVLPTDAPLGVEALVDRAGLDESELFLAVPADLAVRTRVELPTRPKRYRLAPPFAVAQERPGELVFRTRGSLPSGDAVQIAGWALSVREQVGAHALACAALIGQAEGLLVHGAEVRPGVWYARGARVAEDVTLVAPILIGAGARVFGGARLGPNVLVGPGSVIEGEAVLSEVSVAADTLVGEGARIRQAYVDPQGMTSLADGARTEVRDPLLLAPAGVPTTATHARLGACLMLLVLLLPWALVSVLALLIGRRSLRSLPWQDGKLHVGTLGLPLLDLTPALYDVVRGRRDLVGVALPSLLESEPADAVSRPGALDVTAALAPGATPQTLRCMWRWYLLNKGPELDRTLLGARTGRHSE